MNPGSGFGSGFGQQSSSSPFGSTPATTAPVFGAAVPGSSAFGGSGSQAFGSGNIVGTGFGTAPNAGFGSTSTSNASGFGATLNQGFGQGSANTGLGQGSGNIFGTSGSGFGSSAPGSAHGFSSSSAQPVFGGNNPSSGFGAVTASSAGSGGMPFGSGSGFGTGLTAGASVFGANSKADAGASSFGSGGNSSVFGATGGATGFGAGAPTAVSVTSSSGFGTAGFGAGQTGTAGFGTGLTGTAGFGTGQTGTAGFSTGQTGTAGLGTGQTGTAGFGTGQTGTAGFGTGQTGTTAFGTGSTAVTGSGFGGGSSVFGATTSSSSFAPPAAQSSSNFGVASVFGAKTDGSSGGIGSGSSAVGAQGGSAFGMQSTNQGFGGGGSSVFGQIPASAPFGVSTASSSVFGDGVTSGSRQATSTFGLSTAPSSSVATTVTSSSVGGVFGGVQTPSVFGGPPPPAYGAEKRAMPGERNPPGGPTVQSSVFGSKIPPSSSVFGGATSFPQQETSGGFGAAATSSTASVFGGATASSSQHGGLASIVFGGATKPVQKQENVFGGAGADAVRQGPRTTSASSDKAMLFPAAKSNLSGSSFSREDGTAPDSSVSSSSSSVFGGRVSSSVFGVAQTTEQPVEPAGSVFGQGSGAETLPRRSLFPAAGNTNASAREQSGEGKGTFGIFSRQKAREGEGKGSAPGIGHGARALKSGRVLGAKVDSAPDAEKAGSVFGGRQEPSSTVFGGKQEASGVFGGTDKFSFPTGAGVSGGHKRSADIEGEGGNESKRGRGEVQSQGHVSTNRTPERVRLRRSSILEDVSGKTSISVKGVPANLNKGSTLRNHFSQFGQVKQIRCVPSKGIATIQFLNHESAARAKHHGGKLHGHPKPFTIFWKTSTTERSPSVEEGGSRAGRAGGGKRSPGADTAAPREAGPSLLPSLPSSVASELAAMGGGASASRLAAEKGAAAPSQPLGFLRKSRPQVKEESASAPPVRRKTPPPPASSGGGQGMAKVDTASVSSLRRMVATATMDKVDVLNARDKLMRQVIGKEAAGVDRQAFLGTCPDMCPEKERLYREEVRRLSIYEIIPGSSTLTGSTSQVDHSKAVKEYSRSSADQDEPLPHELRPLPVLTMTMNYLLHEIADTGEDGKWSEWYDFLWNRTRSIRKEITQQQLCSVEVVELLEKCVRFHAFCSQRLCAEDVMVFDPKINNENLTKCLQTLKELYTDMHIKHATFCPNEAEFRGYMVLMNLNEGDTLREVQQLRPEVRDSPEIDFAVRMFSALNSNNYVRFFRQVKSASFLSACLCHRYFNQIRARALQIILRSHTTSHKTVEFPLSSLVRLCAFESEADVREFCAYYGLRALDSDLLLDRSAYMEPESAIPFWREPTLVESKRMVSVGELINGKTLEPLCLPPPQCSFDQQGRFIGKLEGLPADSGAQLQQVQDRAVQERAVQERAAQERAGQERAAQERVDPFSVREVPKAPELQPSPLAMEHTGVSNEMVKMIAKELFFEVINESALTISQSCYTFCQSVMAFSKDAASGYMSSVTSDMAREVSAEVLDSAKESHSRAAAAEKEEREERTAAEVLQSIVDSTVHDQALLLARKEIQDAEAKDKAERQDLCTDAVHQVLLLEVTAEMSLQVADQVFQVDVLARLQLLADLQKAVELRRASQWLSIWRKALQTRQRQKRAMLDFPCAPPMQPASVRLQAMYPDQLPDHISRLLPHKSALMVNHRAQLSLLSPLESEHRSLALTAHLSLASLVNSLQRARAWQPLPLGALLRAPLLGCLQGWPQHLIQDCLLRGVQWKLLLSLPGDLEIEDKEGSDDDDMTGMGITQPDLLPVLKHWLCAKFSRGEGRLPTGSSTQGDVLSQYSVDLAAVPGCSSKLRLGLCVRTAPQLCGTKPDEGLSAEQSQRLTKGTSAILFLLPHADTKDDTVWLAARLRLAKLLEAKPMLPPTPLVLLLPCHPPSSSSPPPSGQSLTDLTTRRLGVEGFLEQGLVSAVAVVELPVTAGQPAHVLVSTQTMQTQVTEAVRFLASHAPEPPDLQCQRLGDLVEDTLTQHFFTPALQDLSQRQWQGKLHQAPNATIGLFNAVLDHMALALTSPALEDISWPAPELAGTAHSQEGRPGADWNSKKHLADVYEVVANLRLPWFLFEDREAQEWSQVCRDVWTFVRAVVKKRCDSAVSLTTRISRLLARTCLHFETACLLSQNEDHCSPTYVNAPWTDIILACVDFRLQRLHKWKEEEVEVGGDTDVFYEAEDMEGFEPPASWIEVMLDTEDLESHRVEDTVYQAAVTHFGNKTPEDFSGIADNNNSNNNNNDDDDDNSITSSSSILNASANKTLQEAAADFSQLPDGLREALGASQNLLLHVEEERRRAQEFDQYLERAVAGDNTPVSPRNLNNASAILLSDSRVQNPLDFAATPSGVWSSSASRVPRHRAFDALFLPGRAPLQTPDFTATPSGIKSSSSTSVPRAQQHLGGNSVSAVPLNSSTERNYRRPPLHGASGALLSEDRTPCRRADGSPGRTPRRAVTSLSRRLVQEEEGGGGRRGQGLPEVGETEGWRQGGEAKGSLSQRVDQLKEELEAQRYADQLYEKRLQKLMES